MTCALRLPRLRTAPVFLMAGLLWTMPGCARMGLFTSKPTITFPEDEEVALGQKAFDRVVLAKSMSTNADHKKVVERVGEKLAKASSRSDLQWKFVLVTGAEPEAVCLPGGKMVISEGLLAVCENEAGLATVMSHEMAHVVARHGSARIPAHASQARGSMLSSRRKPGASEALIQAGYGMSAGEHQALPFSDSHELEADSIGLQMMAKAGYDPREAPRMWERMARLDRQDSPEFVRLHRATPDRVATLIKILPTAMAYYGTSPQDGLGVAIAAPQAAPAAAPPKSGVMLASHQETKTAENPIRNAAASTLSSDPFLGAPVAATTTTTTTEVAKVDLQKSDLAAAAPAAGSPAPPAAAGAMPPKTDAPLVKTAAVDPPAAAETSAAPWTGGAAKPDSEFRPTSEARWARPVPVETSGATRVPRPATDLSETPLPAEDDNWRTSRGTRPNPFAGR